MELTVKHFSQLTTEELYELLALRVSIFVVEQHCPYQEVDGLDTAAFHLWLRDEEGVMQAYLRLLPAGTAFPDAALGRVLARTRRQGLATRLLSAGIAAARERLGAERLVLEAQVYACPLYEKAGFRRVSDEFLEDGIPHVKMCLEL